MNARLGSVRVSKPALLDGLRPGHEVIEASAGTGKTYTLQRLVADQVIRGLSTIDRILVVTFTEKATQELRTRIRTYLQDVHDQVEDNDQGPFWEINAEARERLAAALRAFEQAPVSTIHGFCRQVLQEAALEGRTLFDRELADERALFGRAFREALNRVFTQQPEPRTMLKASLAVGRSIEALEQELWNVHADGGQLWPAWEAWRAWMEALEPAWFTECNALALDWKTAKVHHSTLASAGKALTALAANLPQATTDFQRAQVFDRLSLGSLWKATAALNGDHGQLHAWLQRGEASLLSPEALLAHRFLPEIQRTQQHLAQTEGLFTFQGMIHGVVEALEGPDGEALAQRLRQRYDLALVDEFQDTDPLQWQVFRRIFLREDRRLILIGDPKQAIYGFRGGDLPTYQAACAELLQGPESQADAGPQRLERNFRSTASVIEAYNHILGGGADGYFGDPTLYPRPVACGLEHLQATVQGSPLPPVDVLVLDTAQGGQSLWRRLARQLALRVRDLVAAGIQFGEPGKVRVLGYGDVQILVGKASEGELMARALRAEGIPCAFYKQKGLFQTREAEEWLDALRAVADPRNPSAQLRAFMSAFFGYNLTDLRDLASLREDHPALQRLLAWGALAQQQRFGDLLEAMQEESGLIRRLLLTEAGHRALVNVRHIAEALLGVASQRRMTLEDLIRQLDRWRRGVEKPSAEEGDLQRLEGDREAVQILTLHAAKGLEAPIVALFAYGKGRGSSLTRFHHLGQRALSLGSVPEAIKQRAAQEAREESERLLYVGMTRAQAKLILCAFTETNDKGDLKKLQNAYDPLNARLVKLLDQRGDLFRWERLTALGTSPADANPVGLPADFIPPPVPAAPPLDYGPLARAARPFITTSFTALQHRLDLAEAPLRGDRDQPGARPSPGELPMGTATGQALHELLEWADPAAMDSLAAWSKRPEVQAQIQATLDVHGLPRSCAAKVAETVFAGLRSDLPLAWGGAIQIARCPRLLREVDFFSRFVDARRFPQDKDLLKGSIDALCEQDGRVYLLDWKSNLLPDYAPETLHATVMAHYLLQAQVYLQACLAFLDIRDEAAYEARFGGILYVFLRGLPGQGTWSLRPSWAECLAWQRELERVHRAVIEVTHG
ncbi:exodeoxyribonuclease V subunit beta [Geothrix sp. PMB-07]|uniref:UvrD-helicase domain-containing protein n=1 Tax=Geothrix sp. PMB-07 TaxID=3068640 RepID=UPI002742072D|nr:UvrD-helicase domain-containing protein [Geothrix sp. PMB-07]WLT30988.1 UvrD-helicase domain-containing protein [Geothrix sp. PMB-07]